MSRKEFPTPEFDDPIKLNPDSPLADKVQAYLSRRDFLNVALIGSLAIAASRCEALGVKLPPPEGTKTTPTETVPPVALPATEISPSPGVGEMIVITEQASSGFACGGFPALEATGKPYDNTVGGLANISSDCNAMGESSGTLKVFSFGSDTKLPTNIDVSQAQKVSLSLTAYGLDFQAFAIEESWSDRQGQEYPNGLIMVVPDGFGIASGFCVAVPPGGFFLVTFDKAAGSLNRYQLFQIIAELPVKP